MFCLMVSILFFSTRSFTESGAQIHLGCLASEHTDLPDCDLLTLELQAVALVFSLSPWDYELRCSCLHSKNFTQPLHQPHSSRRACVLSLFGPNPVSCILETRPIYLNRIARVPDISFSVSQKRLRSFISR